MAAIFQVAIGLVFIYSLLSILVTTINTVITNLLRWRATHLKAALMTLISDAEVQTQLLSHPLINIVSPENASAATTPVNPAPSSLQEVRKSGVTTVSQIDPRIFAQVLSSILAEKAAIELYGPLLLATDALPDGPGKQHMLDVIFSVQNTGAGVSELRAAIQAVQPELQAPLLTAIVTLEQRIQAAQLSSDEGSRLLPVLEGLRRINDDTFRRALRVVVGSAQTLDEAQQNIEDWFNQRMDQLSDAYKRHVTYLTLAIGLILAVLFNADSLQMARALWEDPALRDTAVTIARSAADNTQLQEAANATPSPEATPGAPEDIASTIADNAAKIQVTLSQINSLNLPIGWEFTPFAPNACAVEKPPVGCSSMRNIWLLGPSNNPNWFSLALQKVIGLVVTVIAIGQGAPFWFDLLRRLVKGG